MKAKISVCPLPSRACARVSWFPPPAAAEAGRGCQPMRTKHFPPSSPACAVTSQFGCPLRILAPHRLRFTNIRLYHHDLMQYCFGKIWQMFSLSLFEFSMCSCIFWPLNLPISLLSSYPAGARSAPTGPKGQKVPSGPFSPLGQQFNRRILHTIGVGIVSTSPHLKF